MFTNDDLKLVRTLFSHYNKCSTQTNRINYLIAHRHEFSSDGVTFNRCLQESLHVYHDFERKALVFRERATPNMQKYIDFMIYDFKEANQLLDPEMSGVFPTN